MRFDNRDVGRSSRLNHLPVPTVWQLLRRDKGAASYTLEDMADDVVGLLDHLGIERAHVVGASMGSMIGQTLAVTHPDRVSSLVSIMGNTGARTSGQPTLRTSKALLGVPPADRDGYVEHMAKTFTLIGSPGFERDDAELRELARTSFDRGRSPAAGARQLAAILASGRPHEAPARDHGAHARHPRQRRQARPPVRRPCDRQGDRRRGAARDPRAWATTSRAGPGRRSSTRSSRTRRGRSQRVIHESGRLASVAIGSSKPE